MSVVAEQTTAYAERFAAFRSAPAFGGERARAMREQAFAAFAANGFPTTRDEEYIFTNVAIANLSLLPPEGNASDMLYVRGNARNPNPPAPGAGAAPGGGAGLTVRGLPLIKPPYGTITAIDMNKGEQLWRIAHGDTPDNIKNNPALKGLNIPRTGRPGRIGILTTKTLLIAGEGGFNTTPEGRGAYLRAYDKATGADAGQVFMPAPQTGSPMTYSINGTQYIAVAVSGPGFAGELLVYKLGN